MQGIIMSNEATYNFIIKGYSKDKIPLKYISKYIECLGALYGESSECYLSEINSGSVDIVINVPRKQVAALELRITENGTDASNKEVRLQKDKINKLLTAHGKKATLKSSNGIIDFPGQRSQANQVTGSVVEHAELQGQLISIGGKDKSVPAHIRPSDNSRPYLCTTNIETAKKLAKHLFDAQLKLYGEGTWLRINEKWEMKKFKILSFEVLETRPLKEILNELRSLGDGFSDDPFKDINEIRYGKHN